MSQTTQISRGRFLFTANNQTCDGFEGAGESVRDDHGPTPAPRVGGEENDTATRHPIPLVGRTAAAAANGYLMPAMRLRAKQQTIPGLPGAQTDIGIFVIKKKAYDKQADFLQQPGRKQHDAAHKIIARQHVLPLAVVKLTPRIVSHFIGQRMAHAA